MNGTRISIPLITGTSEFTIRECKKLIFEEEIEIRKGDLRKMVIEVSCVGKDSTKKYIENGKCLVFDNPYKDSIIKISAKYIDNNDSENIFYFILYAEMQFHPIT